jgi:hypothetical protein
MGSQSVGEVYVLLDPLLRASPRHMAKLRGMTNVSIIKDSREYYLLDIWTTRDYSEIGIEEEI